MGVDVDVGVWPCSGVFEGIENPSCLGVGVTFDTNTCWVGGGVGVGEPEHPDRAIAEPVSNAPRIGNIFPFMPAISLSLSCRSGLAAFYMRPLK